MRTSHYPPGPKGKPFLGHLIAYHRDPIGFLSRIARDYGDIVHFRLGPQDVFLLNKPDYVKDVLVTHQRNFAKGRAIQYAKQLLGEGLLTSEGDFHRRERRLVQPAFYQDRIAAYGAMMTEYSVRMTRRWQHGKTLDIEHEMSHLTMGIVGKALFDADVESKVDEIGQALVESLSFLNIVMLPFFDLLAKLPFPVTRRARKSQDRLDAIIYRIIQERRAGGEDRGDLFSMLLVARDQDGSGMTAMQLRDEAITIFLTGSETMTAALTWTWYLLSKNPDQEARLHAELDSVLAGRLPTVDTLQSLTYTKMIFAEVMRLFPPAWAIARRVLGNYHVGSYILPAGSIILLSQYVLHRDPSYFPDPLRFLPERWCSDAQTQRPMFAYFPFGGGARGCIGEQFAWTEGMLIIATLAQQWRMRLLPGHPVDLQPLIALRPRYGMRMTVERRTSSLN